ncbi:MAG: hypothetical protein ACLP5H_32990 [Desulfomonilaceae bacterium]
MAGTDDKMKERMKAVSSTVVGGAVGYGVVAATGMTAIGAIGGGAGIGAAAGPVGAVAGAVTGLAVYGVYRLFK